MADLIEIDRQTVREIGGSLYVLIPKQLRREGNTEPGDEVIFSKDPETGRTIFVLAKADSNGQRPS